MINLYNTNGLVFWEEKDIRIKRQIEENLKEDIKQILLNQNPQWKFFQIEAPSLIPIELINPNYTADDIWLQEIKSDTETQLALKPETTPSSYLYAEHLLESNRVIPPFVVWQTSKSFRREQDQTIKHMRLKEFSQTEFQCIYTTDTMNDYQENVLEPLRRMFQNILAPKSSSISTSNFKSLQSSI